MAVVILMGGKKGPSWAQNTWEESFFSRSIRNKAPINRHIPWPQSPNITAKRNGNVITEYTAGLISSYRPTLQQYRFVINSLRVHGKNSIRWASLWSEYTKQRNILKQNIPRQSNDIKYRIQQPLMFYEAISLVRSRLPRKRLLLSESGEW